ncbi:MAG TPA: NAD(P)-dependent alcohol dehydrogenase [Candidatus Limnocylindria bacterium]|nr:NAD(P)-dependent alcohol dehydrogenase [Candidatus Limnocylindria bacterium]
MTRMRAAYADRYGGPDVVRVRDVERPTPAGDELLVRVRAASVNRADLDGLKPKPGFLRLFMGLRAPRNHGVGIDAAGVVEAVGPEVARFQPGDEVMTDLFAAGRFGAFAEYVCAREKAFEPIPTGMPFEEAATLPHSAVLALQGMRLRDGRTFEPGARVLIDGASGNVGPFAVQIAKAMGAEVTGVASGDKLDFVRSVGADHVIDYRSVDYTKAGEQYDWIVAVDAHHPIRAVRRALKPGGVYVTMGGTTATMFAALGGSLVMSRFGDRWSGMMLWWKPMHRPDIHTLKKLIADGKLKPMIDRRYRLEEVADALRWVEDGHARGKVVITQPAEA